MLLCDRFDVWKSYSCPFLILKESNRADHPDSFAVFPFSVSSLPPPRASQEALVVKNLPACQCRRLKKIPWNRKWQPTPGFWLEESHGQRSPVGYSPRGCRELNTTDSVSRSVSACTHTSPQHLGLHLERENHRTPKLGHSQQA